MKLFKKAKKGFTLVELVVVIAVIAILAGVSVGAYFGITESAKNSQALQEGKALHTNLVLMANDPADKYCKFDGDSLVYKKDGEAAAKETELVHEIAKAAGKEGQIFSESEKNTSDNTQKYPMINISSTDSNHPNDTFEYHLDSKHIVKFVITTGAQK